MAVILERAANDCAIAAWKDGTILVAEFAGKSTKLAMSPHPWNGWNPMEVPEPHAGTISCLTCPFNNRWQLVTGSLEGHIVVWEIEISMSGVGGSCPIAEWWDGNTYMLCEQYCEVGRGSFCDYEHFNVKVLKTLTGHKKPVTAVSCSADGGLIVSGAADNTVRVWSFATGQELYALKGCDGAARCIAMSADGSLIAVGCGKEVQLWSSASGSCTSERPRTPTTPESHNRHHKLDQASKVHESEVTCVAVSSDGLHVASGSTGKTVHVWSSPSGQTEHYLQHEGKTNAVAMSAGGTFVMAASGDGSLHIWDRKNGKQLASLDCEGAPATHLVTSGDGSIIGTVSQGHGTKVWAWLAAPSPEALQRVVQLAAWEGCPKLLLSKNNVCGATGAGKTSFIRALAGQSRQSNAPAEHQADVDITYYSSEGMFDSETFTLTPIMRDTAGHHLLAWQKAVEDKMVELRNEGRATSEAKVEALSRGSVSPKGRRSWSPINLARRKHSNASDGESSSENTAEKSHRHFKHIRSWMGKGRESSPVATADGPAVTPEVKVCQFNIPELNDVIAQLYNAEVDATVYERLKRKKMLSQGRTVMYEFGSFPGHDALYRLNLATNGHQLLVFNMQELQPGEDDAPRTIHGKTQTVAQWREQCIAQIRSWIGFLEGQRIFLVGTHRDLVSQQDEHRAIHKLLCVEFKERFAQNYEEQLFFFPVDNTAGSDDKFLQHLRYRITWLEHSTPVKSLRFLAALERLQKPLVKLTEALAIGKGQVSMDKDEVTSTLDMLHRYGLLAWWSDVNDGSHVVVDLSWLLAKLVPILKEAKTTGVPLEPLPEKISGIPVDQTAFLRALVKKLA